MDYDAALPDICPEIIITVMSIGINSFELYDYWDSKLAAYTYYFQWDWMQSCKQGN
jgi:hypothetical protein